MDGMAALWGERGDGKEWRERERERRWHDWASWHRRAPRSIVSDGPIQPSAISPQVFRKSSKAQPMGNSNREKKRKKEV